MRFHRFAKRVNPSFTDAPDRSNAYSQNKLFAERPIRAPAQPPIQRSAQSPIHWITASAGLPFARSVSPHFTDLPVRRSAVSPDDPIAALLIRRRTDRPKRWRTYSHFRGFAYSHIRKPVQSANHLSARPPIRWLAQAP